MTEREILHTLSTVVMGLAVIISAGTHAWGTCALSLAFFIDGVAWVFEEEEGEGD